MADSILTGSVHHVTLTVTDLPRARDFYTSVLGFQVALEYGPKILLTNGHLILALGPAPDPGREASGDRFDENRVGLDHLSFSVGTREELDEAAHMFDERGVPHGEIEDLGEALRLSCWHSVIPITSSSIECTVPLALCIPRAWAARAGTTHIRNVAWWLGTMLPRPSGYALGCPAASAPRLSRGQAPKASDPG